MKIDINNIVVFLLILIFVFLLGYHIDPSIKKNELASFINSWCKLDYHEKIHYEEWISEHIYPHKFNVICD